MSTEHQPGEDLLFGAFEQIKLAFPATPVASYYEGVFAEYGASSAWSQTWDLQAIFDVLQEAGATHVVDLCSGDGRIAWGLRDKGYAGGLTCIDVSAAAAASFERRWAGRADTPKFIHTDILEKPAPDLEVNCLVLGNLSVNSFSTPDQLRALLRYASQLLDPNGIFVLIAYSATVLPRFVELSGAMDAVQAHGSPEAILLWRGVQYDSQEFRQNYFVEVRGEGFPGQLGVLREHIWTSDEVLAAAASEGFVGCSKRDVVHVDEGGAAGWPCDVLVLRLQ